jgi:membrane protease YdiL (CAAX protease family)
MLARMNKPIGTVDVPPHSALPEAFGMVMLCFGWFMISSQASLAAWQAGGTARGFSDNILGSVMVTELIFGAVAIAVLQARGYPLRTLYPQPSWSGALLGAGLYLGATAVSALAMLLEPHPAGMPVAEMAARTQVSLPAIMLVSVVNGAYEEVFLLGYLMRGLRRYGASTALGITLLVRLLYHTYQGPVGALGVMLFGAVIGLYYQRSGRLFPVVTAHVITDAIGFGSM